VMNWSKAQVEGRPWLVWVLGVLLILSAHGAGETVYKSIELLTHRVPTQVSFLGAGYLLVFLVVSAFFYIVSDAVFLRDRQVEDMGEPEPRPHLILLLSKLNPVSVTDGRPNFYGLTGKLQDDLLALKRIKVDSPLKRWSWEQALRAIRHHAQENVLETVTVICSEDSIDQSVWFGKIYGEYSFPARLYFAGRGKRSGIKCIEWHTEASITEIRNDIIGCDFENFQKIHGVFRDLLRHMAREGRRDEEIIIDFTGGQKVASVAAVGITLNRRVVAQYVSTTNDEIRYFDITAQKIHRAEPE